MDFKTKQLKFKELLSSLSINPNVPAFQRNIVNRYLNELNNQEHYVINANSQYYDFELILNVPFNLKININDLIKYCDSNLVPIDSKNLNKYKFSYNKIAKPHSIDLEKPIIIFEDTFHCEYQIIDGNNRFNFHVQKQNNFSCYILSLSDLCTLKIWNSNLDCLIFKFYYEFNTHAHLL